MSESMPYGADKPSKIRSVLAAAAGGGAPGRLGRGADRTPPDQAPGSDQAPGQDPSRVRARVCIPGESRPPAEPRAQAPQPLAAVGVGFPVATRLALNGTAPPRRTHRRAAAVLAARRPRDLRHRGVAAERARSAVRRVMPDPGTDGDHLRAGLPAGQRLFGWRAILPTWRPTPLFGSPSSGGTASRPLPPVHLGRIGPGAPKKARESP